MNCEWHIDERGGKSVAISCCGYVVQSDTAEGIVALCKRKPNEHYEKAKMGLGDYTEKVLAAAGITAGKYMDVKKAIGLTPSCNCKRRKEYLNRLSDYLRTYKET